MTEKELEQLFKQKLGERQFEFNPANWQAMEAMLDRKSRSGVYYMASSVAILIYGGLIATLIAFNQPQSSNISETKPLEIEMPKQDGPVQNNVALEEPENDQTVESNITNITETGTGESENNITAIDEPMAEEPSTVAGADSEEVQQEQSNSNAVIVSEEAEEIDPEELIDLPVSGLPNIELPTITGETSLAFTRPDALVKFQSQREWYFMGGVNLNPSYSNAEAGLGWLFGIEYQQRLQKHWSFNVGLQYTRQSNVGLTEVADSTFYSFGQTRMITTTETKQIDYLELPVRAVYHLNPAHQFEGGLYTALRINVSQQVIRDEYSIKGHEQAESNERPGNNNPIKLWDAGVTAAYRYNYSPQLSFGVQLKYGFTDITKDQSPVLEQNHQNLNTRFILRYRLF